MKIECEHEVSHWFKVIPDKYELLICDICHDCIGSMKYEPVKKILKELEDMKNK